MGIREPEIDPNANFNAALAAARDRQAKARQAADTERDDTGEPTEPEGQGSRRPLTDQIHEEAGATPQPREPETGQFLSPDDPLARFGGSPRTHEMPDPGTIEPPEPEPAPEPPPPAAETEQERQERLLAGRFQNVEELEENYLHLERQQGQSSKEVGQLRRTVEDLQRRVYAAPVPAPAPQSAMSQEQIEAGLARNGRDFLTELYENEHPSYDDALEVALAVNPRLAVSWTAEVAAWEAEQRMTAALAVRDQRIDQLAVPIQDASGRDAWNDAWRELAVDNPEMNGLSNKMLEDLQQNQWLTAPLKEGMPEAEKVVIQNLLARARDANRGKVDEARREQADEIGREKTAATVAIGSGTAAAAAGESGPAGAEDEAAQRVKRLKDSILKETTGHNVHEAIHGQVT